MLYDRHAVNGSGIFRNALQPFDDWVRSEVHRIPYQETPRMTAAMSDMLTKLDFNAQREDDRIRHLHIRGQPGVGKTRFALELCRRAPWRATVIYVRQADDVRLSELIDSAAEAPDVRLTVVADEVQPERIEPLRDSVGRTNGRVQLVTIGSCPSPDLRRIPELTIEPLDVPSMRAVISGWYPQMPPEHVDFVTGFADGYVRLGRLTADAVTEDPSATAPDLFDRSDIRRLLDRMLGDGDRRSLYVIAALALVGWTGDRQQEGKAVLAYADASPIVMAFFEELRDGYPELREPLRKRIAGVIRGNEERLPAEQRQTLSRLHARFEDRSLGGRLRQRVGMEPWERNDRNDRLDARALAEELLTAPGELAREWSWLTSGQAAEAWELGAALADADTKGQLDDELPRLPDSGRDLRVVCGYVAARRRVLGDAWYERWMLAQFAREPQPAGLLLQVAWRCGSTDPVAIKVAELLRGGSLDPGLVGQLMYGTWTGIAADALHGLLRAMIDTGHGKTAIGMLRSRMEHTAAEIDRWRPLALELITDIDLIRHANRHWRKVAELIADHPREIAAAIIRAHAHRDASTSWLLRYQRAAMAVFRGCLRRDAGAVWRELTPYLWPPRMAAMFVIGFPAVLEDMPRDDVLAWIASAPSGHTARRAALLAGLTNKHMLTDDRLAARIIADYGDHETVAEAFFSRQVTGAFTGPASSRWQSLAEQLDRVAADTGLPGLRRWARRSADALRAMASRERQHEEEHELLVRAGA